MNTTNLRLFVIAALDDQHGINTDAMDKLNDLNVNGVITDVISRVHCTEGRYYLPEDHGLVA